MQRLISPEIKKYFYRQKIIVVVSIGMEHNLNSIHVTADRLAELYSKPFGGKRNGRFRIAAKLVRRMTGRRRLYEDDVKDLVRAMLERGYVLLDMDGYFVIMSVNTFVNYRRVNEETLL